MAVAALALWPASLLAADEPPGADQPGWWQRSTEHLQGVWKEGSHELFIPFHTSHLHYAYTDEKISSYREATWGLGYGRSRYDETGQWDGVYLMTFLDSHSQQEPTAGFAHQWMRGQRQGWHAGLGYTVFLTARSTEGRYSMLPGAMPMASLGWRDNALSAAFLPGGKGNGNIIFMWARVGF